LSRHRQLASRELYRYGTIPAHSVAQLNVADAQDLSSMQDAQVLALSCQVLSLAALSRQRLRQAETS